MNKIFRYFAHKNFRNETEMLAFPRESPLTVKPRYSWRMTCYFLSLSNNTLTFKKV